MILCRALGPVEVTVDGAPAPPELLWRKNLALLVYLARSPKRGRSREHLIGLLWPDKPQAAARHSLNEALRVLRASAGDGGVSARGEQVALDAGAVRLDTDELEAAAGRGEWAEASRLVAGEFLEGFAVAGASEFETWLAAERSAWRGRSVEALARYADALLDAGRAAEAADVARRALALAPDSDRVTRALMRALALLGDRAGALAQYDTFAARLAADVGTRPDADTQALAERVRRERSWRVARPAAAPEPEARRAPLLGRTAELEQALATWHGCRAAPRAALVLVEGDGGTGKTRLAEELLARARLDGAAVTAVRAVEADAGEAWAGVLGFARGGLLDAPGVVAAPPAALAAFAGALPEWAERFPALARGAGAEPVGRALSEVVRAAAAEQPVVIHADDAHWLDRDSLLALGGLLRDLARARVLVVLTAAPYPPRPELDELRARLGRGVEGVALRLAPLSVDALKTLARWAMPRYDDTQLDRLTRRVVTDSAGLPLLAVELLHAVALGLDLSGARGAWPKSLHTLDESLPGDLPDAVVGAIRVGFRRLSAPAQRVLTAAAVLGDRVAPHVLGRATGVDGDALAAALDELEWQRWLVAEPRGYGFVARIVRQVVERDMLTPGEALRIRAAATA